MRRTIKGTPYLILQCCRIKYCVPLIFILLPFSSSHAAVLELNSGRKIEGKIMSQDKDAVVLDTGIDTPVTYYRDEISNIIPDAENEGLVPGDLPVDDIHTQADKIENEAVALIDGGEAQKGLQLMLKAIEVDPTPARRMNYASILFGNGVSLFKDGKQEQGTAILRRSEEQLLKAIAGFDKNTDGLYLSQCYYLLGEMYLNAFADTAKAKTYYQKAVTAYDHPAAAAALRKIVSEEVAPK